MRSIQRTRRSRTHRFLAATILVVWGLLLSAPALAEERGPWGSWAYDLSERHWAEMPLVVMGSLPPMLLLSPFFLIQGAFEDSK